MTTSTITGGTGFGRSCPEAIASPDRVAASNNAPATPCTAASGA
ncbi:MULTISPECIES: hypothetical protein [unclassified Streptomyces]